MLIKIATGFFVLTTIIIWKIHAILKQRQKTYFLKKCTTAFYTAYTNIDGKKLSHQARTEKNLQDDPNFIYGEIVFESFIDILSYAQPQPGEVFYDLGCGVGKAVIAAALLYPLGATIGIEYLDLLHKTAENVRNDFLQQRTILNDFPHKTFNIHFHCDDFLKHPIHDANIIFINATAFRHQWHEIIAWLSILPIGTRIITTSLTLPTSHYQCLQRGNWLMSWDYCSVYIYKKIQ